MKIEADYFISIKRINPIEPRGDKITTVYKFNKKEGDVIHFKTLDDKVDFQIFADELVMNLAYDTYNYDIGKDLKKILPKVKK